MVGPNFFQIQEGETLIRKYFLLLKKSLLYLSSLFPLDYKLFQYLFSFYRKRNRDLDYKKTLVKG